MRLKNKMGFRAYNSTGVDKNGANCNMEFGRMTKSIVWCCWLLVVVVCFFFLKKK